MLKVHMQEVRTELPGSDLKITAQLKMTQQGDLKEGTGYNYNRNGF